MGFELFKINSGSFLGWVSPVQNVKTCASSGFCVNTGMMSNPFFGPIKPLFLLHFYIKLFKQALSPGTNICLLSGWS
jgi:hypothetical protein